MKKLICLVVMLCGLSVAADEQGYLIGTNTIELVEGESLIVLGIIASTPNIGIKVSFPPYDGSYDNWQISDSSDLAHRTILGPCKVTGFNSSLRVAYKKTSAPVFTNPVNVIMIPVDYEGDVDISLEASTDLQTWTPLYSGSAGTSNDAAFFRTRLIQN